MTCYIIYGLPGSGKTTLATMLAIQGMDRGQPVFSNYPIYHKRTGKYTKRWKRSYVDEIIYKSIIIIDEGYLDYSSREGGTKYAKDTDGAGFTKKEHTMFATARHNENDYYIIAQNYGRIELIIREIAVFWHVIPIRIPIIGTMLGIIIESYDMEEQIRLDNEPEGKMFHFRIPLISLISRAFRSFDTHFYRKAGEMRTDFPEWTGKETINEILMANQKDTESERQPEKHDSGKRRLVLRPGKPGPVGPARPDVGNHGEADPLHQLGDDDDQVRTD